MGSYHCNWSPNRYWSSDIYNGRQFDYIFATSRLDNGVIQRSDSWQVRSGQLNREYEMSFTLGRFHHVCIVIDMNTMLVYIDGNVHFVYTLPPNTPEDTRDVMVQQYKNRFLQLASKDSNSGHELHSFLYFPDTVLTANDAKELAAAYPPQVCGDGIRAESEKCDDGNKDSGDGCSQTCQIETNYVCKGGNSTKLSADDCTPGTSMLHVSFDTASYGTNSNIDTTKYIIEKWDKDKSLPKLHDNVHVDNNGYTTYKRGATKLEVGASYGRDGNGLSVRLRNPWHLEEYAPPSNQPAFITPTSASSDWSGGTMLDIDLSANNYPVYKINGINEDHSLLKVTVTFKVFTRSAAHSFQIIEVDNDVGFAHRAKDTTTTEFFDTLKSGTEIGHNFVRWKGNAASPVPFTKIGKSYPITWTSSTNNDYVYKVAEIVVPHSSNNAEIYFRCTKCTKWQLSGFSVEIGSVANGSPFRPYVSKQLRNTEYNKINQEYVYTWFDMETAGTVLPSSWFSFNFRVVDMPQYNRIWTLTILDAEEVSNSNPPNNPTNANCRATTNCASSNGCSACRDTSFFYRICYHASRENTVGMPNCDETHSPTYGIWHHETVDLFSKFSSRYDFAESSKHRKLKFRFNFYSTGTAIGEKESEMEIHFDEFSVSVPTKHNDASGCGEVYIKSEDSSISTTGTIFKINNVNFNLPSNMGGVTNGFCYIHIPKLTELNTLNSANSVICNAISSLSTVVENLNYGDRLLLAFHGNSVDCDSNCKNAILELGGVEISFSQGSSLAMIGRKGARSGSSIMRYDVEGEGGVIAVNILFCPDVSSSVSEAKYAFANIGPPLSLLNIGTPREALFKLGQYSSGYLGCYRSKRSGTLFAPGYANSRSLWFTKNELGSPCYGNPYSNSPTTCSWCCAVHGFTMSGLNNYVSESIDTDTQCYCGDKMPVFYGQGVSREPESFCSVKCPYGLQTCGGSDWWRRPTAVFQTTGETAFETSELDVTAVGTVSNVNVVNNGYVTLTSSDQLATFSSAGTGVLLATKTAVATKLIHAIRVYWQGNVPDDWQIDYLDSGTNNFVASYIFKTGESSATNLTNRYCSSGTTNCISIIRGFYPIATRQIKVLINTAGTFKIREITLNYFNSIEEYRGTSFLRAGKLTYGEPYESRAARAIKNHTIRIGGSNFKPTEYFNVDQTGQVNLKYLMLNFESLSSYKIVVDAFTMGFTKTVTMSSQNWGKTGQYPSYLELNHGLGIVPGVVSVLTQPTSGGLTGYKMPGVGTVMGDEYYNEDYGGLLFAVSKDKIRLWAPSAATYFKKGYIVNIGAGWGQAAQSHTAKVEIVLKQARSPNYDSGWLQMKSNDPDLSYMEHSHNLGWSGLIIRQAEVRVTYRVKNKAKANAFFEFQATGAQQADASGGRYGGILYAYNGNKIRFWAPNYAGLTERVSIEEIQYYNTTHAKVLIPTSSQYTTRYLESNTEIIFRSTYANKQFDGKHLVRSTVDFNTFFFNPDSSSLPSNFEIIVVKTSTVDVDEIQWIKLVSGTSGDVNIAKKETQGFTCSGNNVVGDISIQIEGGILGDVKTKSLTVAASSSAEDLKNAINALRFKYKDFSNDCAEKE